MADQVGAGLTLICCAHIATLHHLVGGSGGGGACLVTVTLPLPGASDTLNWYHRAWCTTTQACIIQVFIMFLQAPARKPPKSHIAGLFPARKHKHLLCRVSANSKHGLLQSHFGRCEQCPAQRTARACTLMCRTWCPPPLKAYLENILGFPEFKTSQ
jgi:hypothetical protein